MPETCFLRGREGDDIVSVAAHLSDDASHHNSDVNHSSLLQPRQCRLRDQYDEEGVSNAEQDVSESEFFYRRTGGNE